MRLRFLDTVPSDHPSYPFLAGQIIAVDRLTPLMRRWLLDGRARLLDPEVELATIGPREQAVPSTGKRR